jgi:hypothetical protein
MQMVTDMASLCLPCNMERLTWALQSPQEATMQVQMVTNQSLTPILLRVIRLNMKATIRTVVT